jgi:hypothetical protein
VLDALVGVPAHVRNPVLDVVATNDLDRALYAPMYTDPRRPANFARFTFLDPAARDFWVDWPKVADDMVGHLQAAAGVDPHDRALTELVGELSTCSEEFRVLWARRDVRAQARGVKRVHHPVVGRLDLRFENMQLPAEQGLTFATRRSLTRPPATTWPCSPPGPPPRSRRPTCRSARRRPPRRPSPATTGLPDPAVTRPSATRGSARSCRRATAASSRSRRSPPAGTLSSSPTTCSSRRTTARPRTS